MAKLIDKTKKGMKPLKKNMACDANSAMKPAKKATSKPPKKVR